MIRTTLLALPALCLSTGLALYLGRPEVVAFIETYLKQHAADLLNGASPAYPEVDLKVFGADTLPRAPGG